MIFCPYCRSKLPEDEKACEHCTFALKPRGRWAGLWVLLLKGRSAVPQEIAVLHKLRGNALVRAKKYRKAIQQYDCAIKLDPLYSDAFNNRGAAFQHLGKYRQALEDHRAAVKLDPWDAVARYNLGNDLQSLGTTGKRSSNTMRPWRSTPNSPKPIPTGGLPTST